MKIPFPLILLAACIPAPAEEAPRPRAREAGIVTGILPPGPLNAITDVEGVKVGHRTVIEGETIRTGVTAVLPHGGNLFHEKVPGAVFTGNGFGKLTGSTQVNELGEIETPIVLTSTLSTGRVWDAVVDYMLELPGNQEIRSINPLVGETNDGWLNDIRARRITSANVAAAITSAKAGEVEEGAVGAGTGTVAFGWKGGIGTASRKLPPGLGGHTVGVLVQTNFGGVLSINGAPVGQKLGVYYLQKQFPQIPDPGSSPERGEGAGPTPDSADGSCMIILATDAPVDSRNLQRLANRCLSGMARTGASGSNGSGDYAIAFSTRRNPPELLPNNEMSPLFLAAIEATEEAIYNSLFKARTMTGSGRTVEAIPLDKVNAILEAHKAIRPPAHDKADDPDK